MGIVPLREEELLTIDALLQKLHLSLHLSKSEGKNRIAYQGENVKVNLKDPRPSFLILKKVFTGRKQVLRCFFPTHL